jgi:hypothetical protein
MKVQNAREAWNNVHLEQQASVAHVKHVQTVPTLWAELQPVRKYQMAGSRARCTPMPLRG